MTYAGNLETLQPVMHHGNFKFFKGDIDDHDFVYNLFETEKTDILVNYAAESHVARSILELELFLRENIV